MRRRDLLQNVAASSALAITAGTAAGQSGGRVRDFSDLDQLHVVQDGDVIASVENPTRDDARRVEASLDDDQPLASPQDDCFKYCCDDCPLHCSTCGCSCTSSCCSTDCCGYDECC